MKDPHESVSCRSCGGSYPRDELDPNGWCERCRQRLIRRATWVARVVALLFATALGVLVAIYLQPTRLVAGWMALLVGTYVVLMKLVRRVVVDLGLRRTGRTFPADDDAP